MKSAIPPLNALYAFDAAARHESFLKAAHELSVSPGAISRHVKILEQFLETSLFDRRSNGIALTRAGKRYSAETAAIFRALFKATEEVRRTKSSSRLIIATLPVFSERWLNRRLASFQRRHKKISFQIEFHEGDPVDSERCVDAWIFYSDGKHPGCEATLLFGEDFFPVCSPELFRRMPAKPSAELVTDFPRLHDMFWNTDWDDWARARGMTNADLSEGARFALYSGLIQAAVAGMGVAIGHEAMIRDELRSGSLIALRHLAARSSKSYYLVVPKAVTHKLVMTKLKIWFQCEAREWRRQYERDARTQRMP